MKKWLVYMRKNIANDARIIMPYISGRCIIYPLYQEIKMETANKLIAELKLKCVPAYKDYCNHDLGSSMYVFEENITKYQ